MLCLPKRSCTGKEDYGFSNVRAKEEDIVISEQHNHGGEEN